MRTIQHVSVSDERAYCRSDARTITAAIDLADINQAYTDSKLETHPETHATNICTYCTCILFTFTGCSFHTSLCRLRLPVI